MLRGVGPMQGKCRKMECKMRTHSIDKESNMMCLGVPEAVNDYTIRQWPLLFPRFLFGYHFKEEIAMCAKTVVISIEIQLAILPFHLKGSKFNIE